MLDLAVESWIWYGFVIAVAIARLWVIVPIFPMFLICIKLILVIHSISRSLALGSFRKLQVDDFLMIFALCTFTALISTINIVADDETNLLPPGFNVDSLTAQEKEERRTGSKLVLVVEQNQILTSKSFRDL